MIPTRVHGTLVDPHHRLTYRRIHPGIDIMPIRETIHSTLSAPTGESMTDDIEQAKEKQKTYSKKQVVKMIHKTLQKGLKKQSTQKETDISSEDDSASDSES